MKKNRFTLIFTHSQIQDEEIHERYDTTSRISI